MSKSIKFVHASEGTIPVNNGTTSISDIFSIGAVTLTTKRNSETHELEYPTDSKGLEIIAEKADFAANFLTNSVRSIGVLLATVDPSEIGHEIKSIAWLITGLSELSIMVSDTQRDIEFSLKTVDEANVENNGDNNE